MKIQESAENYLEAILILNKRNGEVHAIDIAAELEFSKPSVSVVKINIKLSFRSTFPSVRQLLLRSLPVSSRFLRLSPYERIL